MPKSLKNNGFTFIELLIVVSIIGILIGVSVSNFRRTFSGLQLTNSSKELQVLMNYLSRRSVAEGRIIYLTIDNGAGKYWAQFKDEGQKIREDPIPGGIMMESDKEQILFYPDGSIDKVTVKITNQDRKSVSLTTKGMVSGVKVLP